MKQVKQIETVVFIPATPDSILRKSLQQQDNLITQAMDSPMVRFVERSGVKLVDDVGNTSDDEYCGRIGCMVCEGRAVVGGEKEEESARNVGGDEVDKEGRDYLAL